MRATGANTNFLPDQSLPRFMTLKQKNVLATESTSKPLLEPMQIKLQVHRERYSDHGNKKTETTFTIKPMAPLEMSGHSSQHIILFAKKNGGQRIHCIAKLKSAFSIYRNIPRIFIA